MTEQKNPFGNARMAWILTKELESLHPSLKSIEQYEHTLYETVKLLFPMYASGEASYCPWGWATPEGDLVYDPKLYWKDR